MVIVNRGMNWIFGPRYIGGMGSSILGKKTEAKLPNLTPRNEVEGKPGRSKAYERWKLEKRNLVAWFEP